LLVGPDACNASTPQTLFPCATTLTDLPLAVCLIESAAARIRVEDPGRPLTASVKGANDWPSLSTSSKDFLEVHPYADTPPIDGGNLDQAILDQVRLRRATYGKPVFIGESGLDQIFPDVNALTINARGWIGINQAIWAGAVAGSMNARMLWYEDGYDNDSVGRVNLCGLGLAHGQALERWPRELFVSAEHATHALNHFLEHGKQDPALEWIRIDSFPREALWEGREHRLAWERANPLKHAQVPTEIPAGQVRLIVLLPGEDKAGTVSANGVAAEWSAELSDPREDIYPLNDGQPVNETR
jgi:hypothetical protein